MGNLGSPLVFARSLETAREAGMDAGAVHDLRRNESWCARGQVWGQIMREVRVSGLPIRVAQSYSVGSIGALGLAAQFAPDLRGVFQRLIHHQHVLTGTVAGRMHDDVAGGTTLLEHLPVEGSDLGARCRREMMVASALEFAREVSGVKVRPRRVHFAHAAPRDAREHEEFFECEVRFGSDIDGLELDRDTLAIPLPGADRDLSKLLLQHLRAIAGDPPETSVTLEGRVRTAICRRLGNDTLEMAALARELGTSARTLRRRLLEQGTSYHEILDRVRSEVADELLADADHKLSEIAFLLGFSDASAFHRAYVRWTGCTPASRRRAPTRA
jgi:AraC-like DNA-binding protein